jgi:hypothetical protein
MMAPFRYTDDEIFAALRAAAESRDGAYPGYRAYEFWRLTHPEAPTASLIEKRFRDWRGALRRAGFDVPPHPARHRRWSEYDILDAIVTCAETLGHRPTPAEYQEWARAEDRPRVETVRARFGFWNTAIREAGFK